MYLNHTHHWFVNVCIYIILYTYFYCYVMCCTVEQIKNLKIHLVICGSRASHTHTHTHTHTHILIIFVLQIRPFFPFGYLFLNTKWVGLYYKMGTSYKMDPYSDIYYKLGTIFITNGSFLKNGHVPLLQNRSKQT